MADPGEDFSGYMENLQAAEQAAQGHQEMLNAHEIWRQGTWGGWAVRQIQAASGHFEPFVESVTGMMQDEDSATKVVLLSIIRLVIILVAAGFVYSFAKIFQIMIGGDVIQEEEIVVVHEHATAEQASKARAATSRSKKDKRQ